MVGQRPNNLSLRGRYREESLREDDNVLSPRSPHVQLGLVCIKVGEDGVGGGVVGGAGVHDGVGPAFGDCGPAWGLG
jgi:hypothetical protein